MEKKDAEVIWRPCNFRNTVGIAQDSTPANWYFWSIWDSRQKLTEGLVYAVLQPVEKSEVKWLQMTRSGHRDLCNQPAMAATIPILVYSSSKC